MTQRSYKAFFLAPLVPGVVWAFIMLNPVVLLFAVPLGYIGMFAFGVPMFLFARRYWRVSALSSVLGGALSGALVYPLFEWWSNSGGGLSSMAQGIFWFVPFGAIAGGAFWWLYAPNQALKPTAPPPLRSGGPAA